MVLLRVFNGFFPKVFANILVLFWLLMLFPKTFKILLFWNCSVFCFKG